MFQSESSEEESEEESVDLDWLPDPDKIYGKTEEDQNGNSDEDKVSFDGFQDSDDEEDQK